LDFLVAVCFFASLTGKLMMNLGLGEDNIFCASGPNLK
jgi:hypothetical protein